LQVVNDLTLSKIKCAKIVQNIISKCETEKTVQNLRKQKFSFLLDESTDTANNKIFCILIKYVSPVIKKCVIELIELLQLDSTDCSAEKLYSAFEKCYKDKEIPLNNIIGIACDKRVTIGKHDSFIREIPTLIILKCICHSFALIASKVCSELLDSCENLLYTITTYISDSAKRSAILREFQEFFENRVKFKNCQAQDGSLYKNV